MQNSNRWLDLLEYAILGLILVSLISVVVVKNPPILLIYLPLVCALIFNRLQRFQLEKNTKTHLKNTLHLVNQNQESIEKLVSELQKMLHNFSHQNAIKVTVDGENPEVNQTLNMFVNDLRKQQNHQQILEQNLQLIQAEMEIMNRQFKQRPELEQIHNLTTVILDLQKFINELPQWGNLQQKQLRELQDKVDLALTKLSEELNQIPHLVAQAVEREKN